MNKIQDHEEDFSTFIICACLGCVSPEKVKKVELNNPFIHTAYFWLKDDLSEHEIASFIQDCEKLKAIETIKAFYTGIPAATNRDVIEYTYDFAVIFHFADLADQEFYHQHPLHLEMIEKHQSKWERVMVNDIEHQ